MCRLYGFRATEPTKVECTLVYAQNALMVQSRADQEGRSHGHGWGVATYINNLPQVERQAWAAYHGEHFRRAAARAYSCAVIAHVRRATIGPATVENTHPFVYGRWVFAHNGTLRAFDKIRETMLAAMTAEHRRAIRGSTDSEHLFHLLLSLQEQHPHSSLLETLRSGLHHVLTWSRTADPEAKIGLNVLWSDGEQLVGSRWGRTLWYVEREGIHDCEICGFPHVRHHPHHHYRAVVIASEAISHEPWLAVPEHSVFSVDPEIRIHFEPLE
jgi:glutamine amidotransferase